VRFVDNSLGMVIYDHYMSMMRPMYFVGQDDVSYNKTGQVQLLAPKALSFSMEICCTTRDIHVSY
jgi:hypothetical protein